MKWKVKFTEELYNELNNYLFDTAPKENGCFLSANIKGNTLFVSEIYYPEQSNWLKIGEDLCVPSSEYISKACINANIEDKTLVFVHTHPDDKHPPTFSYIDEISNRKLFDNLNNILAKPLGSFVFSQNGIHGVICTDGENNQIESYTIYGDTIRIIKDVISDIKEFDKKEFDRQLRFMGREGLETLVNMNIAIIGLGGTGSPMAVMLAKMGVKHLSFYDFDKLEAHNLPRIYGATKSDIGKYKVEIVKKHINTFSECEIKTYHEGLTQETDLTKYDVIFGCVDNYSARDFLNSIAFSNAIPYIDTGASIPVDSRGSIQQSVISVNTILPNRPCLWCSKTLDPMVILEESMDNEELEQRQEDGYLQGVDKTPSVITLTTAVSTFAINRLLNILDILSGVYPNKMMFEFNNSMYSEPKVHLNLKCRCQKSNPFK